MEKLRNDRPRKCQTACKPGSVRPLTGRDDHSSGTHLTMRLTRPTRAAGRECPRNYHGILHRDITAAPIRSCSRWGLPCRPCCQGRGALLPHRFALARGTGLLARAVLARAVCFLWHFPWGRPRRPLAGTVFPWSPDFPPQTGLPRPTAVVQLSGERDVRLRGRVVKGSGSGRNRMTRAGPTRGGGARWRDSPGPTARNWNVKYKN